MRPGPAPARPAPSGIVTLLTDFGLDDPYVGVVKGVLLGRAPRARLVDLTHGIPPQDVPRAALVLEGAFRAFPPGTVHLAVVDPGVGTARRALAVAAAGHYFVGPDNGLLGFLAGAPGAVTRTLRAVPTPGRPVSRTFHARDVFAPAAAALVRGVPFGRLGPRSAPPRRLAVARAVRRGDRVRGAVLLADRFGNLLTNLRAQDLPGAPARCVVALAGRRIVGLSATYAARPRGQLGAVIDSSGRVEVFVREGNAQARLGVGAGAPVSLWARSPGRGLRGSRSSTTGPTPGRPRRRPAPPSPRSRRPSSPSPAPSSAPPTGSRSRTSRRP